MKKLTPEERQEAYRQGMQFAKYMPFNDQRMCDYGNWHDPLERCDCANLPDRTV